MSSDEVFPMTRVPFRVSLMLEVVGNWRKVLYSTLNQLDFSPTTNIAGEL
jgi:hypothetical protein